MAELVFLPRVFLGRTEHGSAFYRDRRLGLQVGRGQGGMLRPIAPEELRRGYPAIWTAWVRFAAPLPAEARHACPTRTGRSQEAGWSAP